MKAQPEPALGQAFARDGRIRRGERSRQAIVGALLDLIGGGVLQPTVQQVADRAGVGLRSVFRPFSESETLYAAIGAGLQGEATRIIAGANARVLSTSAWPYFAGVWRSRARQARDV